MLASIALRRVAAQTACSSHRLIPLRCMSDLPYHIVVGMPALSPTMESGTLSAWNVEQGAAFVAGDSLATIDTDKASIDFEAQDDGYVAKLLVKGGTEDIPVGTPIMVTVEEEEDVAAFADFVPPEEEASPEPAKEEAPAEAAAPPPPPPPPAAAAPTPPPPPPPPAPPSPEQEALKEQVDVYANVAPTMGPAWGGLASVKSPLVKTLSAEQQKYIEKYGTTGTIPLK